MRELQLAFIGNRTTSRLFRILSVIERNRLFTIGEIADKMQVTQRTIANDIRYMKDYFGDCIGLVSGNSGYFFEEIEPSIYQERKQKLLENECLFEIIGNIFQGELEDVDELAHRYHFSESTFRRLLGQSTHILANYGLEWTSNPLTISGSEASLRKFYKDFYYEGIYTNFTLIPDIDLQNLVYNKLSNKLREKDVGTGTTPAAFYYTLFIAIKRISLGHSIQIPTDLSKLAYTGPNFQLLYSLREGINKLYNIEMSIDEFAWVYLVTICKRTLDIEESEMSFYQIFNKGEDIEILAKEYLELFELSTYSYPILSNFIRSFFLSRKINHLLSPVLNKEADDIIEMILRSDSENYHRNLHFLNKRQNYNFLSTEYLEDICASLTIYSDLLLDFYTEEKNICFLLEGDHFICQQIRARATQQFGTKHSLTFLRLQYLTQEELNLNSIDLIVTNYNRYLWDFIIKKDYILLKEIPDEQDWSNLERKINPYQKKFS